MSGIMEIKGVLELIEAVTSLEDKSLKLLIMGSANSGKWSYSSYERKVKKFSEKNKDRIIFTGYVDNGELYKYASVADVQCVPTLIEEAAGLVLLEALAEGLPLIVTKSGGVTEYVDKSTAVIIEKENIVNNLKSAICYIKKHPDVCEKMSECAIVQSKKYDEAGYYKNFVRMVFEIIDENRKNCN